jgi:hypothetical protein
VYELHTAPHVAVLVNRVFCSVSALLTHKAPQKKVEHGAHFLILYYPIHGYW